MAKRGRPKKDDGQLAKEQETKDIIVERISDGITLRQCCRDLEIGKSTVYDWLENDGAFAGRIARARELGFDAIADEALRIADTPLTGIVEVEKPTMKDGKESTTTETRREDMLGHRRLQVDTRLKLLAKWDPKRYGDAVQLKHADADGDKLDLGPTAVAIRAASLLKTALERGSDPDD